MLRTRCTLSGLGFVLAVCSLYVELHHELEVEDDIQFVALCDNEVNRCYAGNLSHCFRAEMHLSYLKMKGIFYSFVFLSILLDSNTFSLPRSKLLSYLGIVSKELALNVPNTVRTRFDVSSLHHGLL